MQFKSFIGALQIWFFILVFIGGVFKNTIIPLAPVAYEMIKARGASLAIYQHIQRALVE